MCIEHIRMVYDVPAKIGGRIRYTDEHGVKWNGVIKSVRDGKLRVLVDDRIPNYRVRLILHPTYNVEYL